MGRERRPHIGIFGRRNNGKSTLINFLAGQDIAIVSDVAGTTTDPVKKSFEITGFGPVILIDTAGIDDTGELGEKRITKTNQIIKIIDLAVLVITQNTFGDFELGLIDNFNKQNIPFITIHNKEDIEILNQQTTDLLKQYGSKDILHFSNCKANIEPIVKSIKITIPESAYTTPSLLGDLISYGDIILLITPIDIEAPEGRLILPQVQAIRDILDNDAVCIVLKEREVDAFLRKTRIKPKLVVTDSQVFLKAGASIPSDIPLTSFSIMLAHFKGNFNAYLKGTPKISELVDGDKIILLESCTHHSSCDDIGRVKIPRWISNFTGKKLEFVVIAGLDEIPGKIMDYALLIQCGGCMITPKQLGNRLQPAIDAGIPVTNYGMAIAYVQGIYNRAVAPFAKTENSSIDYL
ncbi:[FeFe] hydrogenase H-cluster maturation GTPase HydF [Labilibaculum euxinus]|uniref:[FeFe] hydrogenase H-cluster maturation GTPase HydF n=1 Tax=Labilibaculum euxinus TaxID=2686357 RepID=A0A7M4D1I3_9BACT|nr:[FeFe] hydrogenase H-cluster maturation GTPase HydF [Labilibaculum euxinus]MUP36512.1 [FeFe] hydrogenase H-cluster maturation GTPase HydF [Labilibaculum euxinus]MVB05717.1 [FeFe] hydrogenase H-cluster maturation GTPase HydF [Labilibaculum euxinus]